MEARGLALTRTSRCWQALAGREFASCQGPGAIAGCCKGAAGWSIPLVMLARTPDVYCIGSQKAATTWLYRCMESHPQVFTSPYKEVHYFDSLYVGVHRGIHVARINKSKAHFVQAESGRSALGRFARRLVLSPKRRRAERRMRWWMAQEGKPIDDDWYRAIFAGAKPGQKVFDVTPAYAVLPPQGVAHVKRLSPAGKVMIILRDPVDRAFSHAKMLVHKDNQAVSDERLFAYATKLVVRSRNDYCGILDRWQAEFSESQFRVYFYEQVQQAPLAFLEDVCGFYGIEFNKKYFPLARKVVYRGPGWGMSEALKARLVEYYRPAITGICERFPEQTREWLR